MRVAIGKYTDKGERIVDVLIDEWDTWAMDETLALIVLPMLKQLKATKQGSPLVDDEDVPHLPKQGKASNETMQYDMFASDEHDSLVWSQYESRWNWVMDQMIYAFESEREYYSMTREEIDKVLNGFRLFGKYFIGLWD